MKKTTLLLAFCLLTLTNLFGQQWTNYSPISNNPKINGFTVFSVDGKGYVIGGSNTTFTHVAGYNDNTYQYDPIADSWTIVDTFPGANRVYGNATTYKGKAYYGFGYAGSRVALNDLWEFDPSTNQWKQLTSCPGGGRAEIAIVALDDIIYVGFGDNFTTIQYSDWWAYDIKNDSWTQKKDFPGQSRHHPQFFVVNNQIYVGLGHDDDLGDLESFYKYDPSSDTWTRLNDFPSQIQGPGGQFVFNGEAFVAFGLSNKDNDSINPGEFWKYSPNSDSWTQLPSFNGTGYLSPLAFIIDTTAYLVTESNYWNLGGSTDYFKYELGDGTTSINNQQLYDNLRIYPNPTTGNLTINFGARLESAKVTIRNVIGQIISDYEIKSTQYFNCDIQGSKGIYLIQIETASGKSNTYKVIKD